MQECLFCRMIYAQSRVLSSLTIGILGAGEIGLHRKYQCIASTLVFKFPENPYLH
jgi:hypothetical protein